MPARQASYEHMTLSSIEWTAKLCMMINHMSAKWPDRKPAVACLADGLSSNLPHLAMLCFSADSFHFDCKLLTCVLDSIRKGMAGQSEYDSWLSSLHENLDITMVNVIDGAWFRFESRKLGLAIRVFGSDPYSASISAYRPFLECLDSIQDTKHTTYR